jgi:hypothetical protein
MTLRLLQPRPLSRLAAAVWGLFIPLLAWIPAVLVIGLLYLLDAVATSLLVPPCMDSWSWDGGWRGALCDGSRWLSTWWWLAGGILSIPTWCASLVFLVRRVAQPGFRLRLLGFMVWMEAIFWVCNLAMNFFEGSRDENAATRVLLLAGSIVVFAIGLWWAFRPATAVPD